MDRINYAGGTLLTGTAIARALLEYASALAKTDQATTVEIPIVREGGAVARASLVIGPASQLVAESVESEYPEPEDDALVREFSRVAAELSTWPHPVASDEAPDPMLNSIDEL